MASGVEGPFIRNQVVESFTSDDGSNVHLTMTTAL